MNDATTIDSNEFVNSFATVLTDLQNAIAGLRTERDRLLAENARLTGDRDNLVAEIVDRQKQIAEQKQREILRSLSALQFLERCAEAGVDQTHLQALADSVAAREPTEPEKAA